MIRNEREEGNLTCLKTFENSKEKGTPSFNLNSMCPRRKDYRGKTINYTLPRTPIFTSLPFSQCNRLDRSYRRPIKPRINILFVPSQTPSHNRIHPFFGRNQKRDDKWSVRRNPFSKFFTFG